jgi:hypothetical protein
VVAVVDMQASTLTLTMVPDMAKRSLAVTVVLVVTVTLTLRHFLDHILLQSVAVVQVVLMVEVQLQELQQLVLV